MKLYFTDNDVEFTDGTTGSYDEIVIQDAALPAFLSLIGLNADFRPDDIVNAVVAAQTSAKLEERLIAVLQYVKTQRSLEEVQAYFSEQKVGRWALNDAWRGIGHALELAGVLRLALNLLPESETVACENFTAKDLANALDALESAWLAANMGGLADLDVWVG